MSPEFKFDATTGTYVVAGQDNPNHSVQLPRFEDESGKAVTMTPKTDGERVLELVRTEAKTPMVLLGADGLPESHLDSASVGVFMFRENEDYDVYQIADEKSGKVLAYIGGYALQFKFNMHELNSLERVEQCLQGLTKFFRDSIMKQQLGDSAPNM